MKLKKMKVYSSVMILGVLSMLNGCSSKEGTMTNSTSQVEYEQNLEEENNYADSKQNINPSEVYNQAANILLEADEKLSEQTVEDSSKGNTISSVEAIQNINTFADLLQKYKDSSEDNKKIIQGNLEQIDIKKEIKTVLEYIVNGNQEAEVIDKDTLRSVTLENNQEKVLEQVLSLCNGRLKKFGDYDFFQSIQVLSPTKKGMLGTKEMNKSLQQELNPHREGEPEKASMGAIFRIGDRVMQIKNNYDMYWEKQEGDSLEVGNGVFNGETGTITNISEKEKNITVKFDDEKVCWYEFNELEQIEHSYCITIHKAQGSEFDVVIMVVPQAAPMLLTRNLLYTGLTRAKKLLIVIGNDRVIDYMIQNVDSKKRNTGLEYKLKKLY